MAQKKTNSTPLIAAPSNISFFDDATPCKAIWESKKVLDTLKIPFQTETFFLKGSFFKRKRSTAAWVQKTFLLNSDCLTYQKVPIFSIISDLFARTIADRLGKS